MKQLLNFTKLDELQKQVNDLSTSTDNQKTIQTLTKEYFTTEIKDLKVESNYKNFLNKKFKNKANELIKEKIDKFNNMDIKTFNKAEDTEKYTVFKTGINKIEKTDNVTEKVRKLKDAVLYNGIPTKLQTETGWTKIAFTFPAWSGGTQPGWTTEKFIKPKKVSNITTENIENLFKEAKQFIK